MFGFSLHTGELPPSSQELASAWRPYIETCIAAFGPERAMFESNFPVDKGSCSHAALRNAFKYIAAGYSAARRRAILRHGCAILSAGLAPYSTKLVPF